MRKALLIGNTPAVDLDCAYVDSAPYDLIVIGSLTFGQLLCFRDERVLEGLSKGLPVYLFTPGLPTAQNRALSSALATAQRELKNWGILFTDGGRRRLITAETARQMRQAGSRPAPGAVLTPLAKEILEGSN